MILRRSQSAMARELDGELVILDVPSGRYYAMNDVGSVVWHALDKPVEVSEIVDAVITEFDVEPEQANYDVRALVDDLVRAGLVTAT